MTLRATTVSFWLLAAVLAIPTLAIAQQGGSHAGVLPSANAKAQADDDDSSSDAPKTTASQKSSNDQADASSKDDKPSGPRVLTPEEIAPDNGKIAKNFPPAFDPLNPPRNVRVNIDFDQAELSDVVRWVSALTAQNFIIADTISSSKKITIISPQPVRIREAYRAFIAALSMNGLTVVPFGNFLKIVEADKAAREANPILTRPGQIDNNDRMVTYIYQLQHVAIAKVQPVLDAMKSEAASLIPYESTNTLIITETGSNLKRLLKILKRLDTPGGHETINIYQVKNAESDALKDILTELFGDKDDDAHTPARRRRPRRRANSKDANETELSGNGTAPNTVSFSKIISDPRTNQLLIISTQRSYNEMLKVVRELDIPIPGEGQIHVVQLKNAKATDLASTLQSLAEGVEKQNSDKSGGSGSGRRGSNQTATSVKTATISGDVSVTADEATNSLVIVAGLRDFLVLKNVVDQLDRRRDQVYVEAAIMEVTVDRDTKLGLALNGGALSEITGEKVPIFGATSLGGLSSIMLDPSSLNGLAVGLQGPEIEGARKLLGIGLPSFGAVLQAMETDSNVNVLSTPHILTLDNEEAEIVVGENVPFVTGRSGGLGGLGGLSSGVGGLGSLAGLAGGNISSALGGLGSLGGLGALGGLGYGGIQIQRQDVALTLNITPHINGSDYVQLEIEEENDDIASDDPIRGPTTTKRKIKTTVSVKDQQTIVLGGLMRNTQTKTIHKVPFLGDIPVIGNLFRHTSTRTVKTNLLLLLTPYIIRDPADFQQILRRKMREREEFMAYFGSNSANYQRSVDYARKNGPMQAMLMTVDDAVYEEEQRARAFGTETEEDTLNLGNPSRPLRFDTTGTDEVKPQPNVDTSEQAPSSTSNDQKAATPAQTPQQERERANLPESEQSTDSAPAPNTEHPSPSQDAPQTAPPSEL